MARLESGTDLTSELWYYICVPSIPPTFPVNATSLIIGELLLVAHYLSLLPFTVRELEEFFIQMFLASFNRLTKLLFYMYAVFCFFNIILP